ncbi:MULTISPECIES: lysophospholipid acyltransferase family protein [Rahnella]|uniref:lysophospholipid acyltransferase family protein n=1 Tax=Rahnella TaxID=34037 RepID=UPI0018A28BBF|nr:MULTISPECIES: lysophospholipid acyltransferase family protein [Rahnella]MBF7996069.1 1-acyl-sn-glycerol-3-phosphate acyltransferase [Rahnella laticis]MBV6821263.1 1-acyl-sn-glycerol-3-phosphate acyltransferase [Rahnella sp. PD12R]
MGACIVRSESALKEDVSSLPNRIWRWSVTGIFFAFFGIGGLLLSLFWFTLLRLIIRQPERLHRMTLNSIRNSFRLFLGGLRLFGVMDYRFVGDEKFQEDTGCLIVANHPSLLDYVILASRMPRCDCIVKQALLKNPFLAGVIKAAGYLVNSGSDELLQACEARLKAGGTLLIFPEGTRSLPEKPITLQRGAANIALRAGCDVRIVHISCQPPMLTKQGKWYEIPRVKPQFVITVADKVKAEDFFDEQDLSPALAARRLTQHLRSELMHGNTQNNEK